MNNQIDYAPDSNDELSEIICTHYEQSSPLEIIGGGTKRTIGAPMHVDKTLSLSKLSGIVDYNPAEMVMTAKTGTPMAEIEAALAQNNQILPFEPVNYANLLGAQGAPTLGGLCAANLSGSRRFAAGGLRDSFLGVHLIKGDGTLIKSGGRVMKNVTGLDLVKLMAGAWGTLGVMTEVTFKILPCPKDQKTLIVKGLNDAAAVKLMADMMAKSLDISGAAHVPQNLVKTFSDVVLGAQSITALRLEGLVESVAIRQERLLDLTSAYGDVVILDAQKSHAFWRQIGDVQPFCDGADKAVWKLSVAPSDGWRIVKALHEKFNLDAFYDWQGGLVWLRPDDACHAQHIRTALRKFGNGHATLIRGTVEMRQNNSVFEPQIQPLALLSERIREQFDPKRIFNPYRMTTPVLDREGIAQ